MSSQVQSADYGSAMTGVGEVRLSPITPADLAEVGDFLHRELNPRLTAAQWASAVVPSWSVEAPNHGFLLRDGEQVVGVHLGFYSEREVDGEVRRFCNLGAWCVLEGYRAHGIRLIRAMLGQKGFTFTDFSPSGNVVALNKRLRFVELDTATTLVPNLPWPVRTRVARLVTAPQDIERVLTGPDLTRYRDHRGAAAARHVVVVEGDRSCHVVFRKDRRKRLPVFASVLHVSDRDLFARHQDLVFRHLLRQGALLTLAETRVVGVAPRRGRALASSRPKMFRSKDLPADEIGYLYSELTCVAW